MLKYEENYRVYVARKSGVSDYVRDSLQKPSIITIKVRGTSRWHTHSGYRTRIYWHQRAATGDCYDNALAEIINVLYKAEVIHRNSRKTTQG